MSKNQHETDINRIKAALVDQNKTCKWLAEQLGKSENTVSRWCTNKVQPSMAQFLEIATLLGVDIKTLIKS